MFFWFIVSVADNTTAIDRIPDRVPSVPTLVVSLLEASRHVPPSRRQACQGDGFRAGVRLISDGGCHRSETLLAGIGQGHAQFRGVVPIEEVGVGVAGEELVMLEYPHQQ